MITKADRITIYTLQQAARILGVHQNTLTSWVHEGKVSPLQPLRRGQSTFFGRSEVERVWRLMREPEEP